MTAVAGATLITVLLMMVVLLTTTVEGRTGSMKCCSWTKTYDCGEMTLTPDGHNGAQPMYPPPLCQETQAGAHCVCGTQYQPNWALKFQRP